MRGGDAKTQALFSYVSCERRVPVDLPLRKIDDALRALSPEFEELYAQDVFQHRGGTPPINCRKMLSCLADLPLWRGPDRRRLGPSRW
jgi:hypothetical protein